MCQMCQTVPTSRFEWTPFSKWALTRCHLRACQLEHTLILLARHMQASDFLWVCPGLVLQAMWIKAIKSLTMSAP